MLAKLALTIATIFAGLLLPRVERLRRRRVCGWCLLITSVAVMEYLTRTDAAIVRMLWLIAVTFWSMKAVVYSEWIVRHRDGLPLARRILFWLAWPGMRPDVFATCPSNPPSGFTLTVTKAILSVAAGFVLLRISGEVSTQTSPTDSATAWLAFLPALVGLSLMLHFGAFPLLAVLWRASGFPAYELFRSPLKSRSLEEFWGRRWNLAFTEMTAWSVFRPLKNRFGCRVAGFASFLSSGLLHELAITVPVSRSYGLPTIYFLIQWFGTVIESRWLKEANQLVRRLWAISVVVAPLPLVFPSAFLCGIVEPWVRLAMQC